jgi:hypothetical protein
LTCPPLAGFDPSTEVHGWRGSLAEGGNALNKDVPSIKAFCFPILKVLAMAAEPLKRKEIALRSADELDLTQEQRALRIPSGRH